MIIVTESGIRGFTPNAVTSNHIIQTEGKRCSKLRDPIEFSIGPPLSNSLWLRVVKVICPDLLNYLKSNPFLNGNISMKVIATKMFVNMLISATQTRTTITFTLPDMVQMFPHSQTKRSLCLTDILNLANITRYQIDYIARITV